MIPVSPGQSSNAYSNYDEGKVFLIWWGSDLVSLRYCMSIKKIKVRGRGLDADSLDLWCVKWCENGMRHSSVLFLTSGIRERKPMLWQKIWKRNSRHFFKHQVDTVITILLKTQEVLTHFCFKTDICWIDSTDSLLSGKVYHPYMINPLPWVDKNSQFHKYQICWTSFCGIGDLYPPRPTAFSLQHSSPTTSLP